MGNDDGRELRDHYQIPPLALWLILAGSGVAGAGGMATLGPTLERAAIEQCFDNASTAMAQATIAVDVAKQHGAEFIRLNELILERTRDRYTLGDAEKERRAQERIDRVQDRRLDQLERERDQK